MARANSCCTLAVDAEAKEAARRTRRSPSAEVSHARVRIGLPTNGDELVAASFASGSVSLVAEEGRGVAAGKARRVEPANRRIGAEAWERHHSTAMEEAGLD